MGVKLGRAKDLSAPRYIMTPTAEIISCDAVTKKNGHSQDMSPVKTEAGNRSQNSRIILSIY